MFEKEVYENRRKTLKVKVGSGLVLFLGNDESPMNYADNTYRFRQDSTFLYYFGLCHPGLSAVLDVDEDRELVFGNDLTIDDIVWMGPQPTLQDRTRRIGVHETAPCGELEPLIKRTVKAGRQIHVLPPYRSEHKLKLQELGLLRGTDMKASETFIRAVVSQRSVKSREEIEEIERAVDITADMHLEAFRMVRAGISEAEVAASVHRTALASGANLAFPIIATIHGETLHNHDHGNRLKKGDLFLLDAGAETAMGYAGDLSSTMPVGGSFSDRQKEIYNVALKAHENAVALLKPGVPFKDVHLLACRTIIEGFKEIGFFKGDVEEALAEGAHALFFPCGTGHMMGLDVHDMENLGEVYVGYDGVPKSAQFGLKSLRLARPLEAGFVLTVEPGIYFIPQLIDLWIKEKKWHSFIDFKRVETYRGFGGLRNEENFLITEEGSRRLGKYVPKTVKEVESIMNA